MGLVQRLQRLEARAPARAARGPYEKPPPSSAWWAAFAAYVERYWADLDQAARTLRDRALEEEE